ncbi:polysaccharide deacetylase family protein [Xanthomonas cerealis]|uniref:polysaccharide deacetylase family protein n=1 Tax=Xanthomonas cerealis TaxID=3390025 RepID=UPI00159F28BD|nr:polysaccharide deacetylase family protein [Xanthomonas translucens]UKE47758.1 polysaccharide deacetylase family protein [Xanthomonas translucens pv. cerealis]
MASWGMTVPETLQRVPRHPYRWLPLALASQGLVAAIWWNWGWRIGLPALLASHAALVLPMFLPRAWLYAPVLSRLPGTAPQVWLTIDDGPSDDTAPLLDLLDRHQAKATFFLVGERATARPALVREILRRGHGVGNHSHTHPQAWFWALGPRRMAREIGQAQQALAAIAGTAPRWYRSVVGMTNPFVAAPLRAHGLTRVAWSARGFDGVACDPCATVARIARDLTPGAIVLLHEGAAHGHNLAIVEGVLQAMREKGLVSVLPG